MAKKKPADTIVDLAILDAAETFSDEQIEYWHFHATHIMAPDDAWLATWCGPDEPPTQTERLCYRAQYRAALGRGIAYLANHYDSIDTNDHAAYFGLREAATDAVRGADG